mmetsp:Transcript_433/g.824  ORF Transcript_433/g.824 Transcript_433/m.824 type:complete len:389 (-) Transcript_433:273-1439(-)
MEKSDQHISQEGDDDALSSLLLLLKQNSSTVCEGEVGYQNTYRSPRKSSVLQEDKVHQQDNENSSLSTSLTIADLRGYFHLPIVEVAKQLGTCTTALKKICRKHKIKKWPYRQIRSLTKSIQSLEMAALNDTMGDDLREQYREQVMTLQQAIDDIVQDPNTNISELAKKLESEWGEGEIDIGRRQPAEPSENVRHIIQAAAATVGVEGSGRTSGAKRKLSHTDDDGPEGQGSNGSQMKDNLGVSDTAMGTGKTSLPAPTPQKIPEAVTVGITQVSQVALSTDSKSSSVHFIGPVSLAPLERRRINKLASKKLVPLIEPDICNHFKMEFLPQGPLLQVRFCHEGLSVLEGGEDITMPQGGNESHSDNLGGSNITDSSVGVGSQQPVATH